MRFCPDCGDPHECPAQNTTVDDKTTIRLAEIAASRDIRVAELAAGSAEVDAAAAVDIAAAAAEADTARAEGKAAGMGEVLEDLGGGGGGDGDGQVLEGGAEAEQAPVVEVAPTSAGFEPSMVPDAAPPPHEKKSRGYWDNY